MEETLRILRQQAEMTNNLEDWKNYVKALEQFSGIRPPIEGRDLYFGVLLPGDADGITHWKYLPDEEHFGTNWWIIGTPLQIANHLIQQLREFTSVDPEEEGFAAILDTMQQNIDACRGNEDAFNIGEEFIQLWNYDPRVINGRLNPIEGVGYPLIYVIPLELEQRFSKRRNPTFTSNYATDIDQNELRFPERPRWELPSQALQQYHAYNDEYPQEIRPEHLDALRQEIDAFPFEEEPEDYFTTEARNYFDDDEDETEEESWL